MNNIPYASVVDSLVYVMVCTSPYIAHDVGDVSRFLSNRDKDRWKSMKWTLIYLRGASIMCLCFANGDTTVDGYANAYMVDDIDERKIYLWIHDDF